MYCTDFMHIYLYNNIASTNAKIDLALHTKRKRFHAYLCVLRTNAKIDLTS